jgi:hypothetical protein
MRSMYLFYFCQHPFVVAFFFDDIYVRCEMFRELQVEGFH